MPRPSRAAVAVLALAVLAACAPRQDEVVIIEPAPAPIYAEPSSGKYR